MADPERASQAPETLLLYPGVFPAASDGTWGNLDGGPELLLGHPAHPRVSRALSWWECRRPRRTGLVCREGSGSEPQHEGSSIAAQGAPQGAGHRDRSQAPRREPGTATGARHHDGHQAPPRAPSEPPQRRGQPALLPVTEGGQRAGCRG